MAEYIDRVKLLDELGESASHHAESGREYQLLLRDRNIVREQPTADVVEREKVNKAIEEIEYLRAQYCNDTYYDCKYEVLGILRKHLGE